MAPRAHRRPLVLGCSPTSRTVGGRWVAWQQNHLAFLLCRHVGRLSLKLQIKRQRYVQSLLLTQGLHSGPRPHLGGPSQLRLRAAELHVVHLLQGSHRLAQLPLQRPATLLAGLSPILSCLAGVVHVSLELQAGVAGNLHMHGHKAAKAIICSSVFDQAASSMEVAQGAPSLCQIAWCAACIEAPALPDV